MKARIYSDVVALDILKTLLTSDQRELIETAKEQGKTVVESVTIVSFDYADAFVEEVNKRYK